jgi:adenine-specific DNA-methyltransferase
MPTLNWIGKEAVVNHHHQVPFHLLKDVPELAAGDPGSGNLIVQGDNLVALKALLPYYAGQVKCIFIDPPYNTGNESWIYNDSVNSPIIREWLGKVVGKEAEDLCRHDKWLCMMYPRLALLRQFLREDGAIFITIDDNEVGNLRLLMNEIFGAQNLLANCVWQKKYTRANDAKYFSDNHDHILAYTKSKSAFKIGRIERGEAQDKAYKNPDGHSLGPWKPTPLHAKSGTDRSGFKFKNGVYWEPPPGTFRRFSDETMARFDSNDEIWFGVKGDATPQRKTFLGSLTAGLTPVTLWTHEAAGDNHIARDEVKTILADTGQMFDNPKPVSLLQLIFQLAAEPNSIVLDSFSGSGTTGHAVLQSNQQDGGNRRFILVEMESEIARDITAERVKRVAQGYTNAKDKKVEGLGGGFRFCELGEPLFDEHGQIKPSVRFADLARHAYFTETGEPLPRERVLKSPLIGECRGVGIYLLFNGILGDKSANGGNILTRSVLAQLPKFDGQKVIYCAGCLLGKDRLQAERITIRQTPYEIKVS